MLRYGFVFSIVNIPLPDYGLMKWNETCSGSENELSSAVVSRWQWVQWNEI